MVLRALIYLFIGLPLFAVLLLGMMRVIRRFYQGPMPEIMADLIDNPWRRLIQPPDRTAVRHGLEPGMTVLEVGPGSGTYTVAAARRLGVGGRMLAIDIEPKMIARVQRRAIEEGLTNLDAQVSNAHAIPFATSTFDAIFMITVIGEVPSPVSAMGEFRRVLSPNGTLAFSELFPDPDYPRAATLIRWAASAGFKLKRRIGNFLYYTLIFEKA